MKKKYRELKPGDIVILLENEHEKYGIVVEQTTKDDKLFLKLDIGRNINEYEMDSEDFEFDTFEKEKQTKVNRKEFETTFKYSIIGNQTYNVKVTGTKAKKAELFISFVKEEDDERESLIETYVYDKPEKEKRKKKNKK